MADSKNVIKQIMLERYDRMLNNLKITFTYNF